jgi:alkylation response protein AidB-like acyl-CoA dehydrogenase
MDTPVEERSSIVAAVREFVDKDVRPRTPALEHADTYPHALVARMRELGLFGALVPPAYGGLGLDVTTYARVIEELCRGWMSLAGVINSHTMAALIVLNHGTAEQRERLLPRFARGEARGGLCLTEPHAGSDVQAIRTTARRAGDHYVISGSKMFVTNGREGNTFALLARTDPAARPAHRGMSCFIVEKGHPGLQVVKSIGKLGYKGVDTAELVFDNVPVPVGNLVGGVEGHGFKQVMSGLETGRINVAARAVGVARAALEDCAALLRAPGRSEAWQPDAAAAVGGVVDLATRVTGARLLTYWAAGMKDRALRCDLEAGMAKLFASETAQEVAAGVLRILGDEATATCHALERHYRDAPLMIIGEGTNEIQRLVISRTLLDRYGERRGALKPLDDLTEETRQMVLAVRQVVERDVTPAVADLERSGHGPSAILGAVRDLGLFGATVDQDHGGLGLDPVTCALIMEEVGRGWMSLATLLVQHLAVGRLVAEAGSDEQRRRLLPALATAECRGGLLIGAPPLAQRERDHWVLTGDGLRALPGAWATLFAVAADTPGAPVLLVDRKAPGLGLVEPVDAIGDRGAPAWVAALRNCRVPDARALQVGDGGAMSRAMAFARLETAAAAVGLCQAALEAALRYSQQRTAFGKPICQHQAIQLKLADMATRVTAARLLTGHAARRLDSPDGDLDAALARLYAGETAYAVTLEAMRIHGGYGYTTEFPVERYYRDAAMLLADIATESERLDRARRVLGRTQR